MRFLFSLSAAVVLGILVLAACNSSETTGNKASGNAGSRANGTGSIPTTAPGHVAPSDGVKRITTVELRDALAKGTAIVVDVRNPTDYQQSHIKGSINIPLQQVEARLSELPRDKMIVTYCS